MATIYFVPASGDADGNLANANNWFDDAGGTIPHSATPTGSDDCTLEAYSTSGSISCNTLNLNAYEPTGSSAVTATTSVSNGNWNGGTLSSPLCASIYFYSDPGAAITGTNLGFAVSIGSNINCTGGNCIFGAFTYSGSVVIGVSATFSSDSSSIFSGAFSGAATPSSGTYSGTVSIPAYTFNATFTGSTCLCSSFTGTHSSGAVTLTGPSANYSPGTYTSGSWAFSNSPNPIFGAAVTILGGTMNVNIPALDKVKVSTNYGVSNGLTGTLPLAGTVSYCG